MKQIPYQDKSYADKKRILREYSIKDEIRYYLDIMCNECINVSIRLGTFSSEDEANIRPIFKELIKKLGFDNEINMSNTFRDLMIDGYISLEIIWDDKKENILSFSRLSPATLVPAYAKEHGNYWIQYPEDEQLKRILYDSQVIFISYSDSETSYVERLMKPYNQLSMIENCMIMYNIKISSTTNKYEIPIKGLSKQKAEESIGTFIETHLSNWDIDNYTGKVTIDGAEQIPFNKNVFLPQGDSGEFIYETLNPNAIEHDFIGDINYFNNKLRMASYLPNSNGDLNNDMREVIRLNKFKSKIKSTFLEIIRKPLRLQAEKLGLNIDNITIDI